MWSRDNGFEPALHHQLIINELTQAANGGVNLIICTPPGSAKSTYTSVLFPPWFLAQAPNRTILACSYAKDLITGFGRRCRNLIELKGQTLGYQLSSDSRAADEWTTTNGGRFFCAGVNAGIAGHRADLAFIDDPIGSEEDAQSDTFREKLWSWYVNDFVPRLKPNASRIIIANRRHEDDLVGRLLEREPEQWKVIKLKRVAEANDILGRKVGERLWPEYFTQPMTDEAMRNPRASGLQQQEPSPVDGDFFKLENLVEYYKLSDLPANLNNYCASDHACSEDERNDPSCLGPFGVDENRDIWFYPDAFWEHADTLRVCRNMLSIGAKYEPIFWWAGKDHITKSIGPFLRNLMQDEQTYFTLIELNDSRNKMAKAQAIQAMTAAKKVHFPAFAPWWARARHELLSFPNGKHDDFVDMIANAGRGLQSMVRSSPPPPPANESREAPALTMKWLKESAARTAQQERYNQLDR